MMYLVQRQKEKGKCERRRRQLLEIDERPAGARGDATEPEHVRFGCKMDGNWCCIGEANALVAHCVGTSWAEGRKGAGVGLFIIIIIIIKLGAWSPLGGCPATDSIYKLAK